MLRHPVALDGTLSDGEWADAAVLCRFEAVPQEAAHAKPSTPWDGPPTSVFVKHDASNIWVGVQCEETDAAYPQARHRPPTGNLFQDDAVQVVLAAPSDRLTPRGKLEMGGYAGALDTPSTAASDAYFFTVNAVGVAARSWNERALHAPRFESAVARGKTGWSAEYRIPLASFGAAQDTAPSHLFFNVFRYRPPLLIGWHLPGWGGYNPLPLAELRLLDADRVAERTKESPREPSSRQQEKPFSARIGYYPLSGSVVGVLDGPLPQTADRATLCVSGQPEQSLSLTPAPKGSSRRLLSAPLAKGTQPARTAELLLWRGTNLIQSVRRDLPAVTAPEWLGTAAGEAYAREAIPKPWTRPTVVGPSIALGDKTLRIGAFGLFDSIASADGESLAGPARIELGVGGRDVSLRPAQPRITPDGSALRVEARAEAEGAVVETRARIEYDGFTEVKLRVSGVSPQALSRLRVRIPLRKELAKCVLRELTQRVVALDGFGFEGPAGPLWVGCETRGLAFTCDTPSFFSADARHQLRVVEESRRAWLEINFVDGPNQVPDPMPVFRFLLQPTPTKPPPARYGKPTVTDYRFELWSDYQGYPDLAKIPELKTWSSAASAAGHTPVLYACQGLAENAPGFSAFLEDLEIEPPWMFYRRQSDPGRGVPCFACCKRGPEGDLQLASYAKLAREAGIRGVLSDGLSVAWCDDSPGHAAGCGGDLPVEWDADTPSRVTAQRTFLKRLRGIFCDTGDPIALVAHTGGALDIHTLSFFDYYMDGEQLARYPRSFQPPLETFAIGYSGAPWGFRGLFWAKQWVGSGGSNRALVYGLLHNTELWEAPLLQETLAAAGLGTNAVFHPYWQNDAKHRLTSRTGDSRLSWFSDGQRTLAIIANTGPEEDTVSVDLSRLTRDRTSACTDLLTGDALDLPKARGRFTLARGHGVAPLLGGAPIQTHPPESEAPPFTSLAAATPLWQANTSAAGVTTAELTWDDCPALELRSKPYQARAVAVYRDPLPCTFTATLKFRERPQRLIVRIGPVVLKLDGQWSLEGPLDGWSEGEGPTTPDKGPSLQPAMDAAGPFELTLSMRNGKLDALANGQPLAHEVQFRMPPTENHRLSVETWAGFSACFRLANLSTHATALYAPAHGASHPVLP